MVPLKSGEELEKMRRAGRLAADLLDAVAPRIQPGVSTGELNEFCETFTRRRGGTSAPLNYNGFPASICTSINEVVCHGIPSPADILRSGDIINIDVTPILDGYHGDASRTFLVGEVDPEVRRLVQRTNTALYLGIRAAGPGVPLHEIGRVIEEYVVPFGYSVVRDFTGHGIGREFHEPPQVLHFYHRASDLILKPGMVITIEPMINLGSSHRVRISPADGWTVTTEDGRVSAQFEHTVAITDSGAEILTASVSAR